MDAIQRRQIVEKDGEILIKGLPCKKGQAVEVMVSIQPAPPPHLTVGRLRRSGLIGLWQDREDMDDSASYARRLREHAQQRGDIRGDSTR